MKRADRRRPRGGLSAGQAGVVFLVTLAAILALTIHANSQWTGLSAGEQLHHALFVVKDWD